MKFQIPVSIPKSKFNVSYQEKLFLIGSCFSQNIGRKLQEAKFNVTSSLFGTIYNPISIAKNLTRLQKKKEYVSRDIYNFQNQKLINFSNQNSSLNIDESIFLNLENDRLKKDISHFHQSDIIVLTFGTAWVYERTDNNEIVANCHKVPNTFFTQRLLTVSEIIEAYQSLVKQLSNKRFVFTVSPVRHVKGGLHENNLSKSTLHLAIDDLIKSNDNCSYFPAYEIVIDELRDYRFYNEDMVHPTSQAVNFVWEKFKETYLSENTVKLVEKVKKIQAAVTHKPFNYDSEEHQLFIKKQLDAIGQLKSESEFLDFTSEINQLNQQK